MEAFIPWFACSIKPQMEALLPLKAKQVRSEVRRLHVFFGLLGTISECDAKMMSMSYKQKLQQ